MKKTNPALDTTAELTPISGRPLSRLFKFAVNSRLNPQRFRGTRENSRRPLFVAMVCLLLLITSSGAASEFYRINEKGDLVSFAPEQAPARWVICHSRSASTPGSDEHELKLMMNAASRADLASHDGTTGFVWVSCDHDDEQMLRGLREDPIPFQIVPKSRKAGHPFARIGAIGEIPAVVVTDASLRPTKILNGIAEIESEFGLPKTEESRSLIFTPEISLEAWLSGSDRYDGYTLVTNALAWAWGVESGIPQMGFCEPAKFPAPLAAHPGTRRKFELLAVAAQTQNNLLNAHLAQNDRNDRLALIGKLAATSGASNDAMAGVLSGSGDEFAKKRATERVLSDYGKFVASLTSPLNKVFRSAVLLRLNDYDFNSNRFLCSAEHRVFVVNELRYLRTANTLFERPTHPVEMGRLPAGKLFASAWPLGKSGFEGDNLRPTIDLYSGSASISLPPDAAEKLLSSFANPSNRVVLALVEGSIHFDGTGGARYTIERGRVAGSVVHAGGGRNPVPVGLDSSGAINGVPVDWKH